MKLIVGLGNPGPRYEGTRHNAGFILLDEMAKRFDLRWEGEKFKAIYASGSLLGERVFLIKPQTFMNLSGSCVGSWLRFYKLTLQDLVVVHDDIDMPIGKVKVRQNGSSGGNNGIKSILAELGDDQFARIKIGVGKPADLGLKHDISDWVLSPLSPEERQAYQKEVLDAALLRLKGVFDGQSKSL